MSKQLHCFDFDGTLCHTPINTPETRQLYEDTTGLPWVITKDMSRELTIKHRRYVSMRSGWFGRPETLEPPLVPNPTPTTMFVTEVCKDFLMSKCNPDVITLVLTGRHLGLKSHVLRILADGDLVITSTRKGKDGKFCVENSDPDVACLFLGDHGPKPKGTKPSETLPWKIWIIKQYVDMYPDLSVVKFWEDRFEHVEEFSRLNEILGLDVKVCYVS